ncbi:MAG: hypothetical protein ACTSQS_18790, partial [Promethearchaeota archaeon]
EYTSDSEAPYFSNDYVASLDEIFKSDTDGDGLLQDDCDGITLVTCSLLIHMGYNAYISECLSHWNTIVFPEGANPKTKDGFEEGIHLYNWWGRESYYIFNETEIIIPPGRPITLSLWELFFDGSSYEHDYLDYFSGDYINLPFIFLILIAYILIFIASVIIYVVVKIGLPHSTLEKKRKRKNILKTSFYTSLIGAFTAFIIFWFAYSGLGYLGTLLTGISIIIGVRYTEFRIVSRLNKE